MKKKKKKDYCTLGKVFTMEKKWIEKREREKGREKERRRFIGKLANPPHLLNLLSIL